MDGMKLAAICAKINAAIPAFTFRLAFINTYFSQYLLIISTDKVAALFPFRGIILLLPSTSTRKTQKRGRLRLHEVPRESRHYNSICLTFQHFPFRARQRIKVKTFWDGRKNQNNPSQHFLNLPICLALKGKR